MANTTVTNVSDLLLTNVTAGVKAGDQKVSDAQGFSEVMNNAKDSTVKTEPQAPEDTAKASRTVVETPKSKEIKAEDPVRKDPVANEDDMVELTEEVAKEAAKIMDTIRQVLGISDEELTEAMENLGITAVDLLDPVSVKDLCMALTQIEDSISLITNADLYEDVKEIIQTAEDAAEHITAEFGLTDDQTKEIFTDEKFVSEVKEAVVKLENKAEVQQPVIPEAQPEHIELKVENEVQIPKQDMDVDHHANEVADNKDTNATAGTDAKVVTVEVKGTPEEKPSTEPKITTNEVSTEDPLERINSNSTETFKATVKTEETQLKGNDEGFEQTSRFIDSEAIGTTQQTTVINTEVNDLGQVVETVTHYSNAEADSIMSQVTESIRVNYSADTTSMELQLHPASLGTVNMQVASTGGVVTAHILVQSEAVKAVLESQLVTLQQTFEEQGQKVEAVEVSVANYDLNRGSSSDADNGSQQQNAMRTQKAGTRRRINLNDLDEEELGRLDEDEKLAADMMARSGNSVDYTA